MSDPAPALGRTGLRSGAAGEAAAREAAEGSHVSAAESDLRSQNEDLQRQLDTAAAERHALQAQLAELSLAQEPTPAPDGRAPQPIRAPAPPAYSGKDPAKKPASRFLQQFENYTLLTAPSLQLALEGRDSNRRLTAFLAQHLESGSHAHSWLMNVGTTDWTWEELKRRFVEAMEPPGVALERTQLLQRVEQGTEESAEEYVARCRELAGLCPTMDDGTKAGHVAQGIGPRVHDRAIERWERDRRSPTDLPALYTAITEATASLNLVDAYTPVVGRHAAKSGGRGTGRWQSRSTSNGPGGAGGSQGSAQGNSRGLAARRGPQPEPPRQLLQPVLRDARDGLRQRGRPSCPPLCAACGQAGRLLAGPPRPGLRTAGRPGRLFPPGLRAARDGRRRRRPGRRRRPRRRRRAGPPPPRRRRWRPAPRTAAGRHGQSCVCIRYTVAYAYGA